MGGISARIKKLASDPLSPASLLNTDTFVLMLIVSLMQDVMPTTNKVVLNPLIAYSTALGRFENNGCCV